MATQPQDEVKAAPTALAAAAPAAPPARRESLVTTSPIALLDTAQFEHMQRIASIMARMDLLPIHLRARPFFYPKKKSENLAPAEERKWRDQLGEEAFQRAWAEANQRTVANCILVVDKALRWSLDPFAVMNETYEVGGKLADQGKLIAAVVNSRAGLDGRLDYEYSGELGTDGRTIRVSGTFKGETKARHIELSVGDAKTANDMWKRDPDQKLVYSGALKWARRHCPEVVLGVMTEDDIERMNASEALRRPPIAESALDAFAAASAALPAAPPPAMEVAGRALDEERREEPREEAQRVTGQEDVHEPRSGAGGEPRVAPPPPALDEERTAKLLALANQAPAVSESRLAASVDPEATQIAEMRGRAGESPEELYTRALGVLRALKGRPRG